MASSLILIGPKGSGKTYLAQKLAALTGADWLDSDALLCALYQRPPYQIRSLYQTLGETSFRRLEESLLSQLPLRPPYILSLGGGAWNANTQAFLQPQGLCVYLKTSPQTLLERIRPLGPPAFCPLENWESFFLKRVEEQSLFFEQSADVTLLSESEPELLASLHSLFCKGVLDGFQ